MHEPNSNSGSIEPKVSVCDDFKSFILSCPGLQGDMPFPNQDQENDLCVYLSYDPATKASIPRDAIQDDPVFHLPPTPSTPSCEFKTSERIGSASALDGRISNKDEHDYDESEYTSS